MFAGHIGVGLALGRSERRVNVGAFVFAALLLDFVLWLFILLGLESVTILPNFTSTHQPEFVFPYSHGLLAAFVWSFLAGIAAFLCYGKLGPAKIRAAAYVGVAVLSHWFLDALVHVPELPIAGENSAKVGLGLWQSMPTALAIEAFIALGGLWLFVVGTKLSGPKKLLLAVFVLLVLVSTIAGMTIAPAPPSGGAMAASSLVTIVIVCALAGWLARVPQKETIAPTEKDDPIC